jgi:tripartite-type tricarboxylate transporter receptor subunit TctC
MTVSRRSALAFAGLLATTGLGSAQDYPTRPVTFIVPFAAGGGVDSIMRRLSDELQKALGQPIIIENKSGASGVIAAREVIRAKPDGYTLFFVNNGNLAVTPAVVKDANYDGVKDFTPIALVSSAAMVAVVPASVPANDVKGFIDYAKANPVAYASAGVGSFGQLATELFANRAGIKMTHVPYKGQGPTTTAAVAGEVQLLITTPSGAMNEFINQKRLKLLAVTSPEPSPLAPGTPTIASVLPGYAAESWFAIIGPAGMPADLVAKLNAAISTAVMAPEIQERFKTFGVVAKTTTPQKLTQMVAEEVARWTPVIRDNNIRTD